MNDAKPGELVVCDSESFSHNPFCEPHPQTEDCINPRPAVATAAPQAEARQDVVVGATYRHYKGDLYTVEGVALESTNGRPRERVVIYRGKTLNVRTEREFTEVVPGHGSRFALVTNESPRPEGQSPVQPTCEGEDCPICGRDDCEHAERTMVARLRAQLSEKEATLAKVAEALDERIQECRRVEAKFSHSSDAFISAASERRALQDIQILLELP